MKKLFIFSYVSNMSYSFEQNIKKLSYSPTDYIKEWSQEEVIINNKYTIENRCICNIKLKIAHLCRNEITGKVALLGSSCVQKILGLNKDKRKAIEIAKRNNERLFEKGIYIEITDFSKYVLDVLRDYMRNSDIQDVIKWLDMYKTNPIMLAVIQDVYDQKQYQRQEAAKKEVQRQEEAAKKEVQRQEEAAKKEAQRHLREAQIQKENAQQEIERQQEAAKKEVQRQIEAIEREELRQLDIQRELEEERERQLEKELWINSIEKKRKHMDNPDTTKILLYDQENREKIDKNNTCHCLLKNNEICRCSKPNFKLSHIPPYEDCSYCYKWKCRC